MNYKLIYEPCIIEKDKVFEKMVFDNGYTYIRREISYKDYLKIIFSC